MQEHTPKCIKGVGIYLKCPYCKGFSIKYGKSKNLLSNSAAQECENDSTACNRNEFKKENELTFKISLFPLNTTQILQNPTKS